MPGKEKAVCQEKESVREEFQYYDFFPCRIQLKRWSYGLGQKSSDSLSSELEISVRCLTFPIIFLQGPLQ